MESIVAQRIKSILDTKQISITAFAKQVGMLQVTCNRQLRGDQAVSLGLIEGFLNLFPEVSAEWLLRGNGDVRLTIAETQNGSTKTDDAAVWRAKYEELEKRYDQLLSILGGTK